MDPVLNRSPGPSDHHKPPRVKPERSQVTHPGTSSVGDLLPVGPGGSFGNSGTTEPAASPVVPLFPKAPKTDVIIRKNTGTGPGIIPPLSTGIIEVAFSRIPAHEDQSGKGTVGRIGRMEVSHDPVPAEETTG